MGYGGRYAIRVLNAKGREEGRRRVSREGEGGMNDGDVHLMPES